MASSFPRFALTPALYQVPMLDGERESEGEVKRAHGCLEPEDLLNRYKLLDLEWYYFQLQLIEVEWLGALLAMLYPQLHTRFPFAAVCIVVSWCSG